jgi:hypothetical protein
MSDSYHESLKRRKTYKFYKYRTMLGWGVTKWKIIQIPEGYTAKSFFDNMASERAGSEQFRSIKYHAVKVPPMDWLEKEILDMRNRANRITQLADDYCWILHEMEQNGRVKGKRKSN